MAGSSTIFHGSANNAASVGDEIGHDKNAAPVQRALCVGGNIGALWHQLGFQATGIVCLYNVRPRSRDLNVALDVENGIGGELLHRADSRAGNALHL